MKMFSANNSRPIGRNGMLGAAMSEYLPLLSLVLVILVGGGVKYAENVRGHAGQMSGELAGKGVATASVATGSGGQGGTAGGGTSGGGAASGNTGNAAGGTQTTGGTGGSTSGGGSGTTAGTGGTPNTPAVGGGSGAGSNLVDPNGQASNPSTGTGTGTSPSDNNGSALASVGSFIDGVWAGLKTQFWGLAEMLLHPIDTATQLKDLAIAFVTEPTETLNLIKEEFKKEFAALISGDPYEVGRILGENVSPASLARIAGKLASLSKTPAMIAKRDGIAKELDVKCSSFLAGTLVWSERGLLPIEQLVVGDIVMGRDEKTFEDSPSA